MAKKKTTELLISIVYDCLIFIFLQIEFIVYFNNSNNPITYIPNLGNPNGLNKNANISASITICLSP